MSHGVNHSHLIPLQHLYTALILGGAKLNESGGVYEVKLSKERHTIIKNYLKRNKLQDYFKFGVCDEYNIHFEVTLLSRKLWREWSKSSNMIEYISPMQLNVNVLNLWVSLFGESKSTRIYMPSNHFTDSAKETFTILFNEIMRFEIVFNSMSFTIVHFKEWFLQQYQSRRPIYEINLILNCLSKNEILCLRNERLQYDLYKGGVSFV
ncbi:hypothetical protein [Lysinibacillus sphaericus]|uniref:hypothetical protein n=1 Tax=Lysinibacillus sphaericus TaxID=1421 RepID=UPI0004D5F1FB|nr:hypothetical protein [Lysinibacillus sphaericus]KEK11065.1 hypothetical protein EP18_13905 [Lysinibacillus sphaericus]PIJ95833.1 hypothetical protein CTN02_21980 [Lysinibacillus sphaericus]